MGKTTTTFKGYRKKDFIKLITGYEEDITDLKNELSMRSKVNVEYIVIDKEEDDKKLLYLKNRMKIMRLKDIHRFLRYQIEYDRIVKMT